MYLNSLMDQFNHHDICLNVKINNDLNMIKARKQKQTLHLLVAGSFNSNIMCEIILQGEGFTRSKQSHQLLRETIS